MIQSLQDELDITGLFTTLLDTLPADVIVLNQRGVIVACNPSGERITGTPASRLERRT